MAEALGRSRGGFSTKIHVRADGKGRPITLGLTPGQWHDSRAFEPLMNGGAIKRRGPGRPRLRPRRVAADKAYSSRRIRQSLRRWRIRITIPRRADERRRGPFDREQYRLRSRVECMINRLKQYRRLATRYEKRAENHRAMWILGCILLWL